MVEPVWIIFPKVRNHTRHFEKTNTPVHKEKYLKTKIRSYQGKKNTSFHDHGMLLSTSTYCKYIIK